MPRHPSVHDDAVRRARGRDQLVTGAVLVGIGGPIIVGVRKILRGQADMGR